MDVCDFKVLKILFDKAEDAHCIDWCLRDFHFDCEGFKSSLFCSQ